MYLLRLAVAITILLSSSIVVAGKETDAKIDVLDARMQRIERVVNNEALLSLAKRVEDLQRQVQVLRGENERLAHELNALKTRQREQYLEIDSRLQGLSGTPPGTSSVTNVPTASTVPQNSTTAVQSANAGEAISATSTPSANASGVTAAASVTSVGAATSSGTTVSETASTDAAQDYKNAFTLLKQGKYDDSIVAFNYFLQNHPDSKYAANAQYWLAEANYVSKRYPQALTEFSKVINLHPASSKVPDAKLKLGFTYYELEKYEEARIELTRLRAQFPNSSVATLAEQRLERMSRENH